MNKINQNIAYLVTLSFAKASIYYTISLMKKQDLKNFKLPENPGVYFFRDKDDGILYIGKATSLKDRVGSYFSKDLINTRGLRLVSMLTVAEKVTFIETESVLEALLLESRLIKKYNPQYNAKEKDNKSFACVVVTKEEFPRVLIMRIRDFEKTFSKKDVSAVYGPFLSMSQIKEAMNIIRKIFPYRDKCEIGQVRHCFNAQIKLCPGVCVGDISKESYDKNISNIKRLLSGKKEDIRKSLEKEMKVCAKKEDFERAAIIRNTLYSLSHIKDTSLIKQEEIMSFKDKNFRIEGYDVAHISGTNRVGVMVVIEGKEKIKSEYKKFKLTENINDDYAGITEILRRRFKHTEWKNPDLIVIDGGETHKKIVDKLLVEMNVLIPCVSVVKDDRHKPKDIIGNKVHVDYHKKEILLVNSEAHRFAISYHKRLRNKIN